MKNMKENFMENVTAIENAIDLLSKTDDNFGVIVNGVTTINDVTIIDTTYNNKRFSMIVTSIEKLEKIKVSNKISDIYMALCNVFTTSKVNFTKVEQTVIMMAIAHQI